LASLRRWHERARELKAETYALYLACRDPRTPWYARALAAAVVAYAFSPIDLIPDPIPVLGYLDDLVLLPVGVLLVLRLIPPAVMSECRERARMGLAGGAPASRWTAAIIVAIWLAAVALIAGLIWRLLRR
jgi:uncharacterized membrane protein YkvA (DUF1232 family)